VSEEQRPKEEALMHSVHNLQSVRIGGYPTPHGERELHAVRVDGEVTILDTLAEPVDGDRDERVVEDGLVTAGEIHALAREYLERASHLGRPLVRADA
jgi:hypothetical protein